ncbi:hypothetical protein [Enterococcus sp. DIV0756]|uniref:hypothetical protein n=1 Tax=Enterococcus sp. DIV0756 TaxID=2774636 RepID=UPI003F29E83B
MNRIVNYLFERINYFFLFFAGLTFFGAIRSSNLNLFEISSKIAFLIIFLIIFLFIVCSHHILRLQSLSIAKKVLLVFNKKLPLITLLLFLAIVIAQIFILLNVTTAIGWDVGAVISGVSTPKIMNDYLSLYPNNQLYFFLMYLYNSIISFFIPSLDGQWIIFQLLNIAFIDIAAILLYKATKGLFNKSVAYLCFYLYMFLFMLSPWIMVPYTDQISLLLVTTVLYLYANLKDVSGISYFVAIIVIGLVIGISFLIKPSSIVYFIAWIIIELLKCIKNNRFTLKNIVILILILGSICLPVVSFKGFMSHQTVVKIDSNKAMPWTHFVMMGISGSGGYNSGDVERDKKIIDPILRKKSNIEVIKQRLADHKIAGYVKFLVQKHFNNTDRGDFGWGRDGTPQVPEKQSKNKVQSFLRDTYYQQGAKTNNVRFIMQIIWLLIIVGMIYSFKLNQDFDFYVLLCIKLTIVGAFLYLLIFEGGRSRYLIQYLPFFLIIASSGWINFFYDFRKKKNPSLFEK